MVVCCGLSTYIIAEKCCGGWQLGWSVYVVVCIWRVIIRSSLAAFNTLVCCRLSLSSHLNISWVIRWSLVTRPVQLRRLTVGVVVRIRRVIIRSSLAAFNAHDTTRPAGSKIWCIRVFALYFSALTLCSHYLAYGWSCQTTMLSLSIPGLVMLCSHYLACDWSCHTTVLSLSSLRLVMLCSRYLACDWSCQTTMLSLSIQRLVMLCSRYPACDWSCHTTMLSLSIPWLVMLCSHYLACDWSYHTTMLSLSGLWLVLPSCLLEGWMLLGSEADICQSCVEKLSLLSSSFTLIFFSFWFLICSTFHWADLG